MSDIPETPAIFFEHLNYPPERPVIKIPLAGAVECVVDITEDTPEARTDAFFEANADNFNAVNDAYRGVKAAQGAYQGIVNQFIETATGSSMGVNRDLRRQATRYMSDYLNTNVTFGTSKYNAAQEYPDILKEIDTGDGRLLEERNSSFVNKLKPYTETDKALKDVLSEHMPPFIVDFLKEATQGQAMLTMSNLYALFRQDIALQKIEGFLQEDTVVPAFVDRLHTLAEMPAQLRDYPGLLELVATHVRQERQNNMLQVAIQRSAPSPESHAHEFLESLENKNEGLPKEFSIAIGVMNVVAGIVESEYSLDRRGFLHLFADKVEQWPPELHARLTNFANAKTHARWSAIRDELEPFVQTGRLPAEVTERTIGTPAKVKKRGEGVTPERTAAAIHRPTAMTVAKVGRGHENIIGDTEKEPISHFAVLKAKGDKSGMKFQVESVDSIEELFVFTNLEDYIDTHKSDKSLRTALEAVIELLRIDPKDRKYTRPMVQGKYIMENTDLPQRSMRRFSAQHFPEAKGEVATKTRVLYDIFNYGGNPTLVIYGAFIKQDIETITKLPPIR